MADDYIDRIFADMPKLADIVNRKVNELRAERELPPFDNTRRTPLVPDAVPAAWVDEVGRSQTEERLGLTIKGADVRTSPWWSAAVIAVLLVAGGFILGLTWR